MNFCPHSLLHTGRNIASFSLQPFFSLREHMPLFNFHPNHSGVLGSPLPGSSLPGPLSGSTGHIHYFSTTPQPLLAQVTPSVFCPGWLLLLTTVFYWQYHHFPRRQPWLRWHCWHLFLPNTCYRLPNSVVYFDANHSSVSCFHSLQHHWNPLSSLLSLSVWSLESDKRRCKSWLCQSPAEWPWQSYLSSRSLNFLIIRKKNRDNINLMGHLYVD